MQERHIFTKKTQLSPYIFQTYPAIEKNKPGDKWLCRIGALYARKLSLLIPTHSSLSLRQIIARLCCENTLGKTGAQFCFVCPEWTGTEALSFILWDGWWQKSKKRRGELIPRQHRKVVCGWMTQDRRRSAYNILPNWLNADITQNSNKGV